MVQGGILLYSNWKYSVCEVSLLSWSEMWNPHVMYLYIYPHACFHPIVILFFLKKHSKGFRSWQHAVHALLSCHSNNAIIEGTPCFRHLFQWLYTQKIYIVLFLGGFQNSFVKLIIIQILHATVYNLKESKKLHFVFVFLMQISAKFTQSAMNSVVYFQL